MTKNHICKYSGCNLGENGERKRYYACMLCSATESWKAMACCREHYDLYIKEVLDARSKGKVIDTLPERTDMTKDDVKKLRKRPRKQVIEETKEELKDYKQEIEEIGLEAVIDKINDELDNDEKKI